jgi:hypothetical protein
VKSCGRSNHNNNIYKKDPCAGKLNAQERSMCRTTPCTGNKLHTGNIHVQEGFMHRHSKHIKPSKHLHSHMSHIEHMDRVDPNVLAHPASIEVLIVSDSL